ncbi:MAG: shikimate dehydrogenase [Pararhodobacter sp.]|nr:shikimate dehydrogenase [Pararhodobacter sp.]
MPLLAAVLGDPVDHSLSPLLHGHWLKRHAISGHYIPVRVSLDGLQHALESLPRLGFSGVNVTVPLKEAALIMANEASDAARRIGAANTLTFSAQGIHADNTDAYGFTWNIRDRLPDWKPERAAVLGAGGASRAVLAALLDQGVNEIFLSNRSVERARAIASEFGPNVHPIPWKDRHAMLEACDTLVNATALGMTGKPTLDIRLDALPRGAMVTDIVYSPLETQLLATARKRGNRVVDGLGMLLHQAVPAFERWFGTRPEVDESLRNAILRPR